jgi:hypothetical protein
LLLSWAHILLTFTVGIDNINLYINGTLLTRYYYKLNSTTEKYEQNFDLVKLNPIIKESFVYYILGYPNNGYGSITTYPYMSVFNQYCNIMMYETIIPRPLNFITEFPYVCNDLNILASLCLYINNVSTDSGNNMIGTVNITQSNGCLNGGLIQNFIH